MVYLEKGSTSNEYHDWAFHMPGTELRSPAHRHRSAGTHLTHLLDHESAPSPRRPSESSPPGAGGSSCTSRERPSRLPAGTSRSRAAVRRLAAGLLLAVAGLLGVSASDSEGTVESGWSIGDRLSFRDSDAGAWASNSFSLLITIKGATPVTIEAEHDSIGGGLEDLVFTLTREGATTDALDAKVTIV